MTPRPDVWGIEDLRLLSLLLSPDYIVQAAREHGGGQAVYGARAALIEVRREVRRYLHGWLLRKRRRLRGDPAFRKAVKAELGVLEHALALLPQEDVSAIESTAWRRVAPSALAADPGIFGWTPPIQTGYAPDDQVMRAVIRATCDFLSFHVEHNRAWLEGRAWQRHDPGVLVAMELGADELAVAPIWAAGASDRDVKALLRARMRSLLRVTRSALWRAVGPPVMEAWLERGVIHSWGGALISPMAGTGVRMGLLPIVQPLGIPLNVTVGQPEEGCLRVGINVDHRVFDGRTGGALTDWLLVAVPDLLKGTEHEDDRSGRLERDRGSHRG